ncbi:MAG TPA: glycoside hydrolase family 3 N-terminal domain-containing protein [Kofleriaceae bacterium]|nr:glycoside hydrolase family 3 N-terminal domain-containing protein [Kofleriaceae bacterium]
MNRTAPLLSLVAALSAACGTSIAPERSERPSGASPPGASRIDSLLARMTLEEKLGQLTQLEGAWDAPGGPKIDDRYRAMIASGEVGSFLSVFGADFTRELQTIAVERSRLGIPLLFAFDVIHGFRTTFPVPLAEAASWHPEAVERAARVAAVEATAAGIHWTFAPMVDVARDARWGRIVEGSGEDPYLGMVMAAARVRGFQGDLSAPDTMLACAKHFAAYGAAEAGRDYNTVDISERTLREIYLPPFRAAVDAGVATRMSGFNDLGGTPASAHRGLLDGVLRREWGWRGFVVSDWESVGELVKHGLAADRAEAGRLALTAGVDMEMVSKIYIRELVAEARAGRVPMAAIDRSVRRVLAAKQRLGLFDDPYRYSDPAREKARILTPEHRAAARAMARESIVLLGNRGRVLPLAADTLRTVAVIGPLADSQQAPLGPWSVPGRAADVVSVLAGVRAALPKARVLHQAGEGPAEQRAAVRLARRADAVILVVGETDAMSGEAKSRSDLRLPGRQLELARAVIAANPRTAVVLMNGRPLAIPELAAEAPALLETWFLGVETGGAVADVLFGAHNPSGKLPVTFPTATGQEPLYYNQKSTGRPANDKVVWSSKYIDAPIPPLFPFGHGLSYTRFEYAGLVISPEAPAAQGTVAIEFTVKNAGDRAGVEVAQLYVRDPAASATRPVLELKGFARVELAPGQTRTVRIELPVAMLAFHGADMRRAVEPGEIQVMVGASSADLRLRGRFSITGRRTPVGDRSLYSRATVR